MALNLNEVLKLSPFVAETVRRQPETADPAFWAAGPLTLSDTDRRRIMACDDAVALKRMLRQVRQRYTAAIAIRDWLMLDPVPRTLAQLTRLAEALLQACVDWLYERMVARFGRPIGAESGRPQHLVILGMGKLGGGELNFSSDIDLIAAYPEPGETDGSHPLDNQLFFIRMVQQLTPLLSEQTAEGFAYRVDWRLRPFGDSGPLAMSFAGMERYYETHGREWERYALVKARPVAGDVAAGEHLLAQLRPFVYRRYLDYSVIDAMRDLKGQIDAEVRRQGLENDIKRGPGGIREIEFWVQAFQLIYGGRHRQLQTPSLYAALEAIADLGLAPEAVVEAQRNDYDLLRRVENHLQARSDEQTHRLPDAPAQQAALAQSLGFASVHEMMHTLDAARTRVQSRFDALFGEPADVSAGLTPWRTLWQTPEVASLSSGLPAPVCDDWRAQLAAFRRRPAFRRMTAQARARLDAVMPLMLAVLAERVVEGACDGHDGLARLLDFIESVLGRSVYLLMLQAQPAVRVELVRLLCASPWLARMLSRHPALLEALLDAETLYDVPSPATYLAGARAVLETWGADEEAFMERLRQWKHLQVFQVAVQDVMGVLPVMRVSDQLTAIAEAVVQVCHQWVQDWMARRHGRLPAGELMVIGYGKLGGHELGYGSDLDLVFLYDGTDAAAWSDGPRPLDGQTWMIRAAQKLLFLLSTQMAGGRLYEVDTRLRPDGRDGLLATSIDSFARYLQHKAWLWELQALVRARCVVGTKRGRARFLKVRRQVLAQSRDPAGTAREVRAMRTRMLRHLDRSTTDCFDPKQGHGGLVDIEFIAQYLVLTGAAGRPALMRWHDTVRILQTAAAAGLLAASAAETLQAAYRFYRTQIHRRTLAQVSLCLPPAVHGDWPDRVRACWDSVVGN